MAHLNNQPTITNIQKISIGKDSKKYISVDDLNSKNMIFDVKPWDLIEHNDSLFWNGAYSGPPVKIHAEKCIVIKPSISPNPPSGMSNFFYDKQLLLTLVCTWY